MPADAAGPVYGPVSAINAFLHDGPAAMCAVLPVFATATEAAVAATPRTMITPRIAGSFFMPPPPPVDSCFFPLTAWRLARLSRPAGAGVNEVTQVPARSPSHVCP